MKGREGGKGREGKGREYCHTKRARGKGRREDGNEVRQGRAREGKRPRKRVEGQVCRRDRLGE
eukprot:1374656-Amorphochlora_amoeboformis.AAC.1